jgi:hypothetical protein
VFWNRIRTDKVKTGGRKGVTRNMTGGIEDETEIDKVMVNYGTK